MIERHENKKNCKNREIVTEVKKDKNKTEHAVYSYAAGKCYISYAEEAELRILSSSGNAE